MLDSTIQSDAPEEAVFSEAIFKQLPTHPYYRVGTLTCFDQDVSAKVAVKASLGTTR